jgi:hypothetical protein
MKPSHSKLNGEVSVTSSQGTPGRSNNEVKIQKGERNLVKHKAIITTVALVISCGLTVVAQTPQFNIVKPSTTGVPGEEVRVMKFDSAGNLWIAGRFSKCDANSYRDAKA